MKLPDSNMKKLFTFSQDEALFMFQERGRSYFSEKVYSKA